MTGQGEDRKDYFSKNLVRCLAEWQRKTKKKQRDFCAELGVTGYTLTLWKRGKSFPRKERMVRICEILGVSQKTLDRTYEYGNDETISYLGQYLVGTLKSVREMERYLDGALKTVRRIQRNAATDGRERME